MTTILPELEVRQAFRFFAMGKNTLNYEDYLNSLKNVGIILNKQELADIQESGKTDFNEEDFVKDYNNKMKQMDKDEILKVFQAFDPDATGTVLFEVFNRALVTYGERLSKEEANRFYQLFKIKIYFIKNISFKVFNFPLISSFSNSNCSFSSFISSNFFS